MGKLSRGTRCGLILLALGAAGDPAVAADRISSRVEVFGLFGLNVLTLHTSLEETGDRYALKMDYATTGLAGLVVVVAVLLFVRRRTREIQAGISTQEGTIPMPATVRLARFEPVREELVAPKKEQDVSV